MQIFAATFWPPEQIAQSWKDVAELAILFVAALFGLVQLALLRRQQADAQRQQADAQVQARRSRAQELDAMLTSEGLTAVRKSVNRVFPESLYKEGNAVPIDKVSEEFAKNPGLQDEVEVWLGHWETVALTVYAGTSDEDMTYEFIGGMLIRYGERFREYIKDLQARHSHKSFCYLDALSRKWRVRRNEEMAKKTTPYFLQREA